MDRYQRVEKPRDETPMKENEIRVMAQGRMHVENEDNVGRLTNRGKEFNEIVLKAMGRAINKTVMIVELIKRRVADLHQTTVTGSTDIIDTWEPLEEGLLPLETRRHVSMITITLSKNELEKSSPGYQSPIPPEQVKPLAEFDYGGEGSPNARGHGRGGRGRGMNRGNGAMNGDYGDGGWDRGHGYARGSGRGRGRAFRGHARGGFAAPAVPQQDAGGYNDEAPPSNRGRGRGRGSGRGQYRGRGREYKSNGVVHVANGST
ncbi:hypothetical protein QJS10_CPB11g02036 [Acorus calamus]|uniref:DNA/RNA-binding protein Alba-like domain-containing protein n=1 Tax=Acorus calamus TaxID=4465 RepID=A0AAV9DU52_ACOCL|nr:hypothetical protein QJS10_CPB11g02036 [Acorus calamus]